MQVSRWTRFVSGYGFSRTVHGEKTRSRADPAQLSESPEFSRRPLQVRPTQALEIFNPSETKPAQEMQQHLIVKLARY